MALVKTNSLAATGGGDSLVIKNGYAQTTGTWVGTVALQIDLLNDDTWVGATDKDGAALSFTANFCVPIDNSIPVKTRLHFTRTSGTAVTSIKGE